MVILILGKGIQEQRLSQVLKTITILMKGSINQQEIIIQTFMSLITDSKCKEKLVEL